MTPDSPSPCQTENAVVDFLRERGAFGRGKYQTSMDRRDLKPSQWMRHLQEELGDALQYAERVRNCDQLLEDARQMLLTLQHERGWESAADWLARYDAQFAGAFPPATNPHSIESRVESRKTREI